jgi:hypothetical protein
MPAAVLVYPLIIGRPMFTGAPSTMTTLAFLAYPAALSGAVSGSRFFALYAAYAERDQPTDAMSQADAAAAQPAVYGPIGDWWWSSLVAGVTGGIAISCFVAADQQRGAFDIIGFAIFIVIPVAFVALLAWALGAVVGTAISVFISGILGIVFGLKKRKERRGTLTWLIVSVFLLFLLITGIGGAGVGSTGGYLGGYLNAGPMLYLAGFPVQGYDFLWGPAVLVICRTALWVAVVLFLVLVAIGLPHLLERQRRASGGGGAEPAQESVS